MNKIKQFFVSLWAALDGRKRDIGALAGVASTWLVAEKVIDQPTAVLVGSALSLWVAGAFAHAIVKKDL